MSHHGQPCLQQKKQEARIQFSLEEDHTQLHDIVEQLSPQRLTMKTTVLKNKEHNIASPHRIHYTVNCCSHSLKASRSLLHTTMHPKSKFSEYPGLQTRTKATIYAVASRNAKHHACIAHLLGSKQASFFELCWT